MAEVNKLHVMLVGHLGGPAIFGAERSLLDILAAIDRSRFSVSCVLPQGSSPEYQSAVERHTQNVTLLPYHWWTQERPRDPAAIEAFEEIFCSERVDLVHVNTITLMDPLVAARNLGVPSILHARELIDKEDVLSQILGGEPSAIIETIRAAADFIIANSETTLQAYRKADRSFRLYNCVDVDRFDLPNDLEPERLKVGIISSNLPKKGIESFIELAAIASSAAPELEFLVIGPRSLFVVGLEEAARQASPSAKLGFLDYVDDPAEAIRALNVVVSLSAESFGRTIAEAMAARRPVIAYALGAAPELLRHGTDGFLIPYRDLGAALEHLRALAADPDRVREMGREARQRAQALFSPPVFAAGLDAIYQQIMDQWNARSHAPS